VANENGSPRPWPPIVTWLVAALQAVILILGSLAWTTLQKQFAASESKQEKSDAELRTLIGALDSKVTSGLDRIGDLKERLAVHAAMPPQRAHGD